MHLIITGGHSGMGLELTKKLLGEGHHIGLIVRSEKRREDALHALGHADELEVFLADLSKRGDVQAVADQVNQNWPRVDGIFNNAGVLLDQRYHAESGVELHLEVNAISPYLLTTALKPSLDKSDQPFVTNTATGGLNRRKSIDIAEYKKPTQKFKKLTGSYLDSKMIQVLLMNHLDEAWPEVRIVSVNPGAIKTKMTSGSGMPGWLRPLRNLFFLSPERGALSLHNAAFSSKYEGSGIYIDSGKVRPMQYKISEAEIQEVLAVD